jgi:hypothetical protein
MNGLTAKRLRQLAHAIVLSQGESPGKDANLYNQESNCISWEPAYEDGHRHDFSTEVNENGQSIADLNNALHPRAKDPDGNPLLGMFHNPGTLHHANKTRVIYNHLKKLWKQTGGNHEIFGKRFRRIVNTYAEAAPVA